MAEDFYKKQDLKYLEIATCVDRYYKYRPGILNFTIPIIEPYMEKESQTESISRVNMGNIVNKDKSKIIINPVIKTNTYQIELPADIVYDNYNDDDGWVEPGEKFLIEFVGGDITRPKFLERYDVTPEVIDHHQIHMAICTNSFHAEKPGVCSFVVPILKPFMASIGMSEIQAQIPIQVAETCPKNRYNIVSAGQKFDIAFIDGKIDKPLIMGRRNNLRKSNMEEASTDHDLKKVYEAIYVSGMTPWVTFDLPGLEAIAPKIGLSLPITVFVPDYYVYDKKKCVPMGSAVHETINWQSDKFGISFLNGDKRYPIIVGVYRDP